MTDAQGGSADDMIGLDEAATLLEVPVEQVQVMVDQGLVTRDDSSAEPTFLRAEVLAVRQAGG